MGNFFQELKRRKVFRVAAVYAVVAWLLIQVSDVVLPTFDAPSWVNQTIIFLFILGFIPTLIAAWAYDISPEGVKPDHQVQAGAGSPATSAQPVNYLILAVVLLVAGIQLFDRFTAATDSSAEIQTVANTNIERVPTSRYNLNLGPIERRPIGMGNYLSRFEFTPDGSELIYTSFKDNLHQLNIRRLEDFETRVIAESMESIDGVKVSPNGRLLVFRQNIGDLYIQTMAGGMPQPGPVGVQVNAYAWLDNNHLIYLNGITENVYRYALDTQESELLFDGLRLPFFQSPMPVPGTNSLIFTANRDNSNARPGSPALMLINLDTAERRLLLDNANDARLVNSNRLVFIRGNDLWAVSFDLATLEIFGDPVRLISGVENGTYYNWASYAISSRGLLLYMPGQDTNTVNQRSL